MISNISEGITSTYNVGAFDVEKISSSNCGATVTKSGEYVLVIKRLSDRTTNFVFVSVRN